ncbi:MAG: H-type small acid-soluble spore protein [Alicyclobacillus sp.]|nr:H-type small acid-soluble spore protein [Alicyclobacillus sp.]
MDLQQALDIVNSPERVVVTYEGDPVWIDDVDPDSGTALIHSETTGRMDRVRVERLHTQ